VASRAPLSSECFSEIRYLLSPPRLLPAGATSCRVGLAPTGDRRLCTAHRIARINGVFDRMTRYRTLPSSPLPCQKLRRTCIRAPRSLAGPRDGGGRERGRRPERRGPAPLRNDAAPTEKEFWEVWSEEREQGEGAPGESPRREAAPGDVPNREGVPGEASVGESSGPVI